MFESSAQIKNALGLAIEAYWLSPTGFFRNGPTRRDLLEQWRKKNILTDAENPQKVGSELYPLIDEISRIDSLPLLKTVWMSLTTDVVELRDMRGILAIQWIVQIPDGARYELCLLDIIIDEAQHRELLEGGEYFCPTGEVVHHVNGLIDQLSVNRKTSQAKMPSEYTDVSLDRRLCLNHHLQLFHDLNKAFLLTAEIYKKVCELSYISWDLVIVVYELRESGLLNRQNLTVLLDREIKASEEGLGFYISRGFGVLINALSAAGILAQEELDQVVQYAKIFREETFLIGVIGLKQGFISPGYRMSRMLWNKVLDCCRWADLNDPQSVRMAAQALLNVIRTEISDYSHDFNLDPMSSFVAYLDRYPISESTIQAQRSDSLPKITSTSESSDLRMTH